MSKFRRRKHVNVIVAAFMLFFFTGSAFALISSGPLVFNSVVAVDATLELIVTNYKVIDNPHYLHTEVYLQPSSGSGTGTNVTTFFDVIFTDSDQYVIWEFTVKNLGTIPARIEHIHLSEAWSNEIPMPSNFPVEIWGYHIEIMNLSQLIGAILAPDEEERFEILVSWNPEPYLQFWPKNLDFGQSKALPINFVSEIIYGIAN